MAMFSCAMCRKETSYLGKSVLVCNHCHRTFCQQCIQPKNHRCRAIQSPVDNQSIVPDLPPVVSPEQKIEDAGAKAKLEYASRAEQRRVEQLRTDKIRKDAAQK